MHMTIKKFSYAYYIVPHANTCWHRENHLYVKETIVNLLILIKSMRHLLRFLYEDTVFAHG